MEAALKPDIRLREDPVGRIQTAYTFDPISFHRELEAKLVVDNQLCLEALHDLAAAIVANPKEATREVLELLRFDPDWLETQEEETSYVDRWYVIALADQLIPAPSLSHRCPVSHLVLQYVLPLLGWSREEWRMLLYGTPLQTLLEASGNDLFIAELWVVNQYGGWLSLEVVTKVLSHLLLVRDYFPSPLLEARKEITDLVGWWSRSPAELLSQAYADAREMLETALARKQALYLLLDT
jgi:hypothetical protein